MTNAKTDNRKLTQNKYRFYGDLDNVKSVKVYFIIFSVLIVQYHADMCPRGDGQMFFNTCNLCNFIQIQMYTCICMYHDIITET